MTELSFYLSSKITDKKKLTYKKVDLMSESEFNEYKKNSSELGWPSIEKINKLKDKNEGSCIDVYGDSFIYGYFDNLGEKDLWSYHLSKKLECKVGNFGISGYGNDQAFLHFEKNIEKYKKKRTVVLYAVTSINIKRNLNRFRGLINGNNHPASKPRYIVENGKLKLIEKYDLSYKSYKDLYSNRGKDCLPFEDICKLHSYNNQISKFPYSFFLPLSLVKSKKTQALLKGYSLHQYLYDSNFINARTIVSLLVNSFNEILKGNNIEGKVLLLPTLSDIKYALKNNKNQFEKLIKYMKLKKIPYIDFLDEIVKNIKEDKASPEDYFLRSGHFSQKSHLLLSNFISESM